MLRCNSGLIVGVLCLVASSSVDSLLAEDGFGPIGGDPVAMFREEFEQQARRELNCLRLVTQLSPEKADAIWANLQESIDDQVAQIAEDVHAGNPMGALRGGNRFQDTVAEEAGKVLDAVSLRKYKSDVGQRIKFQRRAAQRAFLSQMDGLLQLSNRQQTSIARVLVSSWDDEWNHVAQMGSQAAGGIAIRDKVGQLPQQELTASLRESQVLALEEIKTISPLVLASPVKFAEKEGTTFGKLRLEEMKQLCGLSEEQVSKLNDAFNQAIPNAVQRKEVALKVVQDAGLAGGPPDMNAIGELSRPVQEMILEDATWNTAIETVLSKAQLQKYKDREVSRLKRNAIATTSAFTTTMAVQSGGITANQMVQLAKLVQKHAGGVADLTKQAIEVAKIPDSEFKKILNDEQLQNLAPMFQGLRLQAGMN